MIDKIHIKELEDKLKFLKLQKTHNHKLNQMEIKASLKYKDAVVKRLAMDNAKRYANIVKELGIQITNLETMIRETKAMK